MPILFTDKFISQIQPSTHEQTYTDSKAPLIIRVRSTGAYYYFRSKRFGKIRIGKVGLLNLKDARIKANEMEILAHAGKDPRKPSVNLNPTLSEIYELFLESEKFKDLKSANDLKSVIEKYTISRMGKMRVSELNQRECKEHWKWLKRNADGNNPENTARLCLSYLSTVLKWADKNIPDFEMEINPTLFSKDFTPTKRRRVLTELELRLLLKEIAEIKDKYDIPFYQFLMCVLLTGIRNGELRQMRWSEIERNISVRDRNDKLTAKVTIWNCPPESTKDSRPIRFVLSDYVTSIIDTIQKPATSRDDGYVFFGKGGHIRPMTPPKNQVTNIRCKLAFQNSWTLHDLRRTMITWLSENGESAADIDRLIGKVVNEGAASHRIYDHAQKLDVSAALAKRWADYIADLED